MTKILTALSVNMNPDAIGTHMEPISIEVAKKMAISCESAIGHSSTAAIVNGQLGTDFEANRVSITLGLGEEVLVAQYRGDILAEGATTLPEGAEIRYYIGCVYSDLRALANEKIEMTDTGFPMTFPYFHLCAEGKYVDHNEWFSSEAEALEKYGRDPLDYCHPQWGGNVSLCKVTQTDTYYRSSNKWEKD